MIRDRRFEEETQVGQDRAHLLLIDLHSGEQFTKHHHINHQRDSQKRVFADVVGGDSVHAVHEDRTGVLVQGTFGVANEGNVLNNHFVVNVFVVFRIQDRVALDGVVQNSAFRELLRLEALVLGQVLAVVVAQMVVGNTTGDAQAGTDQKVAHDRFETGLSGLEVTAGQQTAFLLGILHHSGVERVLRRTIKVQDLFFNARHAEKHGGGHGHVTADLVVQFFSFSDFGAHDHFGVRSPEDHHLVNLLFHVLDVFADFGDAFFVGAFKLIIDTVALIPGDELGVQHRGERTDFFQIGFQSFDQSRFQHVRALAGLVEISTVDIPAGNDEVHRVDHRNKVLDGLEDVLK